VNTEGTYAGRSSQECLAFVREGLDMPEVEPIVRNLKMGQMPLGVTGFPGSAQREARSSFDP
jgi:hypothetical protein